jgi:hypothetical protein
VWWNTCGRSYSVAAAGPVSAGFSSSPAPFGLFRRDVVVEVGGLDWIGLVSMPCYVVFELSAPVVELAGLVLVPAGLLVGAVAVGFGLQFILVAYGFALLIDLVALAVEELSFHRYQRWRDLWSAVATSVLENIGFRQLAAVWRCHGIRRRTRRPAGLGRDDSSRFRRTTRTAIGSGIAGQFAA